MGKTYSKKQKWTELNISLGIGRPVFGNMAYRQRQGFPRIEMFEEKLCRHPNKKSKKSGLRKELCEVNGPMNPLAYCRNSCGIIWERSSRQRLLKSTENGSRRAKIKKHTIDEINDFLMEG